VINSVEAQGMPGATQTTRAAGADGEAGAGQETGGGHEGGAGQSGACTAAPSLCTKAKRSWYGAARPTWLEAQKGMKAHFKFSQHLFDSRWKCGLSGRKRHSTKKSFSAGSVHKRSMVDTGRGAHRNSAAGWPGTAQSGSACSITSRVRRPGELILRAAAAAIPARNSSAIPGRAVN
jgi:hypothetical protein